MKPKIIITLITIFGICGIEFVFPFNFTFYKINHPRRWGRVSIIKCNKLSSYVISKLFRVKFENVFINVLLEIDTCL